MACDSLPARSELRLRVCGRHAGRVLVALCVGFGALMPAEATTFVRMDERDLALRAGAAVVGTVTTVGTESSGADGPISTVVAIAPEQVLFGDLPAGVVTLREPGGRLGGRAERVFGSAEYRPGERVLAFLSRARDGTWHTTAMAMGKYELAGAAGGEVLARRDFGDEVGVIDPASGVLSEGAAVEQARLADMVARVRAARPFPGVGNRRGTRNARARSVRPLSNLGTTSTVLFTYLGNPSRWFEPDDGVPLQFAIDPSGDAALGAADSVAAAVDALAAWTAVAGTSLMLTDGVLDQALPFAGCAGDSRVVFNDPFDEIEASVDCRGVLGIGGFCYTDERRTVNGTSFQRIRLGKVTIGDGWAGCPFWTRCGMAQVITHEIGHAIGLGHSPDGAATMAATARFDGRCAGLGADDVLGVRAIYPAIITATPTPTPTFTARPSSTVTATATRTPTSAPDTATPTSRPGTYRLSGRLLYYGSDLPVASARVTLAGASSQTASSNANGQYTFADVDPGAVSITPAKLGDSGLGISALDAARVLQISAGLRSADAVQQLACDVTGNGSVSPLDAARILQRAVGLLPRFPAAETCGSDWVFVPDPAAAANQEAVEPELALGSCRAGALNYVPLQVDAGEQNFRAALIGDCTGNWQPGGDSRAAEPELAPSGTALVMQPLRRVRGGRWRLAVGVQTPVAVSSLQVELRYDADRLTPGDVHTVRLGDAALVDARIAQAGRLQVALASATALPFDGRAVLVVDFAAVSNEISSHLVRPYGIVVDERMVPTPVR